MINRNTANHYAHIIGIDEAGRGPLAGPLIVGGVLVADTRALRILKGIRDSKKLTEKQREKWYGTLVSDDRFICGTARISPRVIDRLNIARAADRGALRVYRKLIWIRETGTIASGYHVLLDAGIRLPEAISHKIFIKGDERIPLIAAASIIAKVTRDRLMRRLHKKYPLYGFDVHKGYGTKLHRERIKEHGLSPAHRISFRIKT